MRVNSLVALAIGASLASPALSAPAACISEQELGALISYMAPPVLRSAVKVCSTTGQSPFLAGSSAQVLIGQYETQNNRNWPLARAAMLKVMGEDRDVEASVIAGLSDSALRELMNAGFVVAVAGDIKSKDCAKIDRVAVALSRVPVDQATQLVAALVGLTEEDKFNLCKVG